MNSEFGELSGKGMDIDGAAWGLVRHYMEPILPYFVDPAVTGIFVNRFDTIFIRKDGLFEPVTARFKDENHLFNCINQIVNTLGQEINPDSAPIADARLRDGSRVNAVLYPTAHRGSNMTIRLFPKVRYTVEDLLNKGAFNEEMLNYFRLAVACEYNTLVSGATGSGKTTLLNALGNLAPDGDRMGVIEDTAELDIRKPNMVSMEAPKRSIQTADPVTMERLLVNTLRQELKRIMVGEVREPKAATALMLALNTGHRGVYSTLHANDAPKALRRIINMLLSNDTRIPYEAVRAEIYDNFDLIIQAERTPRHGQRVVEVCELDGDALRPLWKWDYIAGTHKRVHSEPPRLYKLAEKYGIQVPAL
ncbi:CpaF family protein [Herbaspirillum sp. HC18]|nr:CpaF family protein [Herbaspirillum sp. HC18]